MLKYNILNKLNNLPYSFAKRVRKEIPKQVGCSHNTFKKWLYIKHDEATEIRGDALIMMAEFFSVEPKELYSIPPKKLKIARETIPNPQTNLLEQLDYDNDTEI